MRVISNQERGFELEPPAGSKTPATTIHLLELIYLALLDIFNAGKRIRTSEGTKPADFESAPFDRSGIPACENKRISLLKKLSNYLNYSNYEN